MTGRGGSPFRIWPKLWAADLEIDDLGPLGPVRFGVTRMLSTKLHRVGALLTLGGCLTVAFSQGPDTQGPGQAGYSTIPPYPGVATTPAPAFAAAPPAAVDKAVEQQKKAEKTAASPTAQKAPAPSPAAPNSKAPAKPVVAPPRSFLPMNMDMALSRETPRKLLETFYFAIEGAEFQPDLLETAAKCLDNQSFMGDPATLTLSAVHLGEVLDHFDLSHIAAPEKTTATSHVVLKEADFTISMRLIPGDGWRFDADTVSAIPEMRRDLIKLRSSQQRKTATMAEGRQSPETLVRTFRSAIARRDFVEAASCLDPTGNTQRRWHLEGPNIARKLAYIIQRCGFLFSNECPNDPDGPRFTWFASPNGMISMSRVLLPDGKEAWVFDRTTIQAIPSLLELVKKQSVDPRWNRLGIGLDDSVLRDERILQKSKKGGVDDLRPAGLPVGLESPKALLDTFFKGVERTRVISGAAANNTLEACLDLEPARRHLGRNVSPTRVSIMLDSVLRTFDIDTTPVSEVWNDDPQTLKGPNGAEVTLRRADDGGWLFDYDTLIRLPEMYNKLGPGLRSSREKLRDFDTPRSTYATFEWAMYRAKFNPGEIDKAVECIDLSSIPAAARANLGPRIAWKIRYILDHDLPEEVNSGVGAKRFQIIQTVPNQTDGRRWAPVRSSQGETIAIARVTEGSNKDKWLFTNDTIGRAEKYFTRLLEGEVVNDILHAYPRESDPEKQVAYWFRSGPEFFECPAVWVHMRIPSTWRTDRIGGVKIGLELWQWAGLLIAFAIAYIVGWIGTQFVNMGVKLMLGKLTKNLPQGQVFKRLGPVRLLFGFALLLYGIDCLDLPMAVEITILPISKTIWAILMLWTLTGLVDLGKDLWQHRDDPETSSSIQDLLIPTVVGLIKALLFLGFGYYLIRLMGDEDLLNRILAGLGILTLGVSLAAQDAIKNYFGTLLLASERPFRIGDRVSLANQNGVIEQVGYRSTRIRTDKGSLITIPNSKVIEGSVENLGRRNRHFARISLPLSGIPDEANAQDLIKETKDLLRQLCPRVHKQPHVDLLGTGEGGPSLVVRAWLPGWGGNQAAQGKEKFLTQVATIVATHGLIILGPPQPPTANLPPMRKSA